MRFVPGPAFVPLSLLTIGLLPEPVRERYGFRWGPARRRAFGAEAKAFALAAKRLPGSIRLFPQARAAERRVARYRAA